MPIPVTVLTGFLGAGKTTLLRHILTSDHGLRAAVLVNDFGALNIDQALIANQHNDTVTLTNGCICCTLRDDLLQTAQGLLNQPQPPEYVLIEASGVADPAPIALVFEQPSLQAHFTVDAIAAVVDCEAALDHFTAFDRLFEAQLAWADLIVLNKTDLISPETLTEIEDWVRELVPRARILSASFGQVPLPLLLSVGHYQPGRHLTQRGETHLFSTASYQTEQLFNAPVLMQTLNLLPPDVLRLKGWINTYDAPHEPVWLQVTGRRIRAQLAPAELAGRSQLVAIGQPGFLSDAWLSECLAACHTPPADHLHLTQRLYPLDAPRHVR